MLSQQNSADDDPFFGDITEMPASSVSKAKPGTKSKDVEMKVLSVDQENAATATNATEEADAVRPPAPLHAWVGLGISVIAVSSSGFMLKMIDEPPITKAAWRMQATCFVLLPGFIWDYRNADIETKIQSSRRNTILLLCASGVLLGLHFGSWIWSLDETSLAHSLLFVQAHPLMFVCGSILLFKLGYLKELRLSKGEMIGSFMGFTGLGITLLDSSGGDSDSDQVAASWTGDMLSFFAASCMLGYLIVGSKLRKWMPLFIYALPVNVVAMTLLTIIALIAEDTRDRIIFGWMWTGSFLLVAYQAFVPGLIGHAGLNRALRHLDPIVVSVALNMEPLMGTFMGWAIGEEDTPGMWTLLGGLIMIAGCTTVTLSSARRSKAENKK